MPRRAIKQTYDNDKFQKAYNNYEFLNSPAARNIRILTEMIEPADRLRKQHIHNTVVFFGSARTISRSQAQKKLRLIKAQMTKTKKPTRSLKEQFAQAERDLNMSAYYEDAVLLAEKLTKFFYTPRNRDRNFRICTGGGPGIMEAGNRGAKKAKGESVGLNINIPMEQNPNPYQTKDISFEFHYFFIRKFWFFYLAKALVIFPGGFGTMDEMFELLTIVQTKKSAKYMPIVLYGSEYWNEVLNFKALEKWGMISKRDLKLFKICDDVQSSYDYIRKEMIKHYRLK